MREIAKDELREILASHEEWLATQGRSGKRADLSKADLSKADLSKADLSKADLGEAKR